jgi:hypothetical protein
MVHHIYETFRVAAFQTIVASYKNMYAYIAATVIILKKCGLPLRDRTGYRPEKCCFWPNAQVELYHAEGLPAT